MKVSICNFFKFWNEQARKYPDRGLYILAIIALLLILKLCVYVVPDGQYNSLDVSNGKITTVIIDRVKTTYDTVPTVGFIKPEPKIAKRHQEYLNRIKYLESKLIEMEPRIVIPNLATLKKNPHGINKTENCGICHSGIKATGVSAWANDGKVIKWIE